MAGYGCAGFVGSHLAEALVERGPGPRQSPISEYAAAIPSFIGSALMD